MTQEESRAIHERVILNKQTKKVERLKNFSEYTDLLYIELCGITNLFCVLKSGFYLGHTGLGILRMWWGGGGGGSIHPQFFSQEWIFN